MCMIVDTNQFHKLFKKEDDSIKPIHEWLNNGGGKLVYTLYGKFGKEIKLVSKIRRYFEERKRAIQLKLIPKEQVEEGKEKIKQEAKRKNYNLQSDDLHILGLAQISNTKLLCSSDTDLHQDFKQLIQGSVYQNQKDEYLLTRDVCP